MAASLNKVCLIGNLGADPESVHTNNGAHCVKLRVATSESWKDRSTGERKESTEWHSVVIWNEGLARVAENYLRKGSKVYLEGKLQTRKWQDQSGNDRFMTEVVLQPFGSTLVLLDGAKKDENAYSGNRGSGNRDDGFSRGQGWAPNGFGDDLDDDVPF